MLWEKKFVTGTFSILAVGSTPDAFYAEITDNAAWWKEWMHLLPLDTLPRGLLSRDRETQDDRVAFLKAYPSLTLDTRHFSPGFLDRLLAH